jgi:HPt (histidine-containing phosphotransfer) domain-containing protein
LDPVEQNALNQALERLWDQYQPQIKERIAILESAASALAAKKLTLTEQEAAHGAAHKLAGVLGTFGLTKGTVLAREVEMIYSRDGGPDRAQAASLTSIAAELRTIVASRK